MTDSCSALDWLAIIGIRRARSQLIISVVLEPADSDTLEGTDEIDRGAHEYLSRASDQRSAGRRALVRKPGCAVAFVLPPPPDDRPANVKRP
jgi:hypothetical protein